VAERWVRAFSWMMLAHPNLRACFVRAQAPKCATGLVDRACTSAAVASCGDKISWSWGCGAVISFGTPRIVNDPETPNALFGLARKLARLKNGTTCHHKR